MGAVEDGLPIVTASRYAISSVCWEINSAILRNKPLRTNAGVFFQVLNATLAASTALSTSLSSPSQTSVTFSSVVGLKSSNVFPETEEMNYD